MVPPEVQKGCHYQEFDPRTLSPTNEATRTRLEESSLLTLDFSGKSVLDIGCNLGLYSLLAAQRGAKRVLGIDVTESFVVQSEENSGLYFEAEDRAQDSVRPTFEHVGFTSLTTEAHGADIVLCFEVLHWLTAQGVPIEASVSRLRDLTSDMLVLEFPWDATERSIVQQTSMTNDDYHAELIFRELLKHFVDVRIVRFATYMADPSAKRILVHAS